MASLYFIVDVVSLKWKRVESMKNLLDFYLPLLLKWLESGKNISGSVKSLHDNPSAFLLSMECCRGEFHEVCQNIAV